MLEYVLLYLLDVLIWLIIVTLLAETIALEYFSSYCSYWCSLVMLRRNGYFLEYFTSYCSYWCYSVMLPRNGYFLFTWMKWSVPQVSSYFLLRTIMTIGHRWEDVYGTTLKEKLVLKTRVEEAEKKKHWSRLVRQAWTGHNNLLPFFCSIMWFSTAARLCDELYFLYALYVNNVLICLIQYTRDFLVFDTC